MKPGGLPASSLLLLLLLLLLLVSCLTSPALQPSSGGRDHYNMSPPRKAVGTLPETGVTTDEDLAGMNVSYRNLDALLDCDDTCHCSLCSESSPKMISCHGCNLCGSHEVTDGLLCMTTGLWRAEYCSTCAAQQKEDGIVCVKVVDGSSRAFTDLHLQHGARLEVNVYNDSSDEFIDLHGRCGVCYRQATHGVEMPACKQGCQWKVAATWCNLHKRRIDKQLSPPRCWCKRAPRLSRSDSFNKYLLCLREHIQGNRSQVLVPCLFHRDVCTIHALNAQQQKEAGSLDFVDPQAYWRSRIRSVLLRSQNFSDLVLTKSTCSHPPRSPLRKGWNYRRCQNPEGCMRQSSFGDPIAKPKRLRFCSEHKLPGYIDLKNSRCCHNGCNKRPSYGDLNSTDRFEKCEQAG